VLSSSGVVGDAPSPATTPSQQSHRSSKQRRNFMNTTGGGGGAYYPLPPRPKLVPSLRKVRKGSRERFIEVRPTGPHSARFCEARLMRRLDRPVVTADRLWAVPQAGELQTLALRKRDVATGQIVHKTLPYQRFAANQRFNYMKELMSGRRIGTRAAQMNISMEAFGHMVQIPGIYADDWVEQHEDPSVTKARAKAATAAAAEAAAAAAAAAAAGNDDDAAPGDDDKKEEEAKPAVKTYADGARFVDGEWMDEFGVPILNRQPTLRERSREQQVRWHREFLESKYCKSCIDDALFRVAR
jgi:hypothetical protein